MKVRDTYLAKAETLTDSQTKTIPIPRGLKIQSLRIKYNATNGATSNTLAKLNGMVSKLEVVDGSDLLHSLSMREEQALNFFCNRCLSQQILTAGAAAVVTEEAIINFGRFIGDRDFYLDTARFSNPALKLTHALTISATAGFATGTGALSVIARVIEDGAPPYRGFMLSKEAKSWTTAASGDEPTLLPLDFPYAALMVGALKTTILPDAILTNLKLQVDAGRFIPFDLTGTDVLADNIERYGNARQNCRPLTDTAATWLSDLYYQGGAVASRPGATSKLLISSVTAEQVICAMTTGGTADGNQITVDGYAPHASFYLPFGDGVNPDDYLSPQGMAELKLILTQGTVAAAGTVVAHQLRQ